MQFDKQAVLQLIEEQMGSQQAQQAARQLSDQSTTRSMPTSYSSSVLTRNSC